MMRPEIKIFCVTSAATTVVWLAVIYNNLFQQLAVTLIEYGLFITISAYVFCVIVGYARLTRPKDTDEAGYIFDATSIILLPPVPSFLYIFYEITHKDSLDGGWQYVLLFLLLTGFVLIYSIRIGIETNEDRSFTGWVLVPLSIILAVLFLGSESFFKYSTDIPGYVLDYMSIIRYVMIAIPVLALVVDTIILFSENGAVFKELRIRFMALDPYHSTGQQGKPSDIGDFFLAISNIAVFVTTWGRFTVELIFLLFRHIIVSIGIAIVNALQPRSVIASFTLTALMLITLLVVSSVNAYAAILANALHVTDYDVAILGLTLFWFMWIATYAILYSVVGFKSSRFLPSSVLIVSASLAVGIWACTSLIRILSSIGAINAHGFRLDHPSVFFWIMTSLIIVGCFFSWLHAKRIRGPG